nr:hypothetical protein [Tanacetum cinerariifolium]
MEAQPEITQNISSLKLPMLKTKDCDLWTVGTVVPPKTKTQKLARKNELKAKRKSSPGSNSHNVASVSSESNRSINKTVTVAHDIPVASSNEQPSASSYADDVMFSFFASQSNTPQLDNEDLE